VKHTVQEITRSAFISYGETNSSDIFAAAKARQGPISLVDPRPRKQRRMTQKAAEVGLQDL
jgi:hypothetical protein